jgi:hypothetical protein
MALRDQISLQLGRCRVEPLNPTNEQDTMIFLSIIALVGPKEPVLVSSVVFGVQ